MALESGRGSGSVEVEMIDCSYMLVDTGSGAVEARAYNQRECFAEALRFARSEGIIPAPEPSHALRALREEVERADAEGAERTFLVNLCGHGNFDMAAYETYLAGELVDHELPQSELDAAAAELAELPAIPG